MFEKETATRAHVLNIQPLLLGVRSDDASPDRKSGGCLVAAI
jgi:hypothetical protein